MTNKIEDMDTRYAISEDGCWIWIHSIGANDYGQMRFNGQKHSAHRLSWLRHKGPIPDDLLVLHTCNNPKCINIEHLYLGTQLDNMHDRDRQNRGVFYSGEANGKAKLTVKAVQEIRQKLQEGARLSTLAKEFCVSSSTIDAIASRKTWRGI